MTYSDHVGLALSGGGFRAAAFGLGCLRALHDTGVLDRVVVVSGISGGSLLASLWAYGPRQFDEFDHQVVDLLRGGLQFRLATRVISPRHLARRSVDLLAAPSRSQSHNRTDVLADVLAERVFGQRLLPHVTHGSVSTVLTATDLITGRALRFGSRNSTSSVHGRILEPVTVAEAVAASAAYPLLLPAMTRTYTFERGQQKSEHRVDLTDGGVFDNLGLSALEPGRNPAYTGHVYNCDYLIACDAGRQGSGSASARLLPQRLWRSFDITYCKTQDGTRSRLHSAGGTGQIRGFVHAYLGMRDDRLPLPAPGLIPLDRVNGYPTNFKAMSADDLHAVAGRGEQLTRLLLSHYRPALLPSSARRMIHLRAKPVGVRPRDRRILRATQ